MLYSGLKVGQFFNEGSTQAPEEDKIETRMKKIRRCEGDLST